MSTREPLTGLQVAVLEFERDGWWKYAGAKQTAVRAWFGMSETRYYAVLAELLELPAAEVYDPQLVRRLRRDRERKRAARGDGRGYAALREGVSR